ncbi:DUF3617 domain-containing protein [Sphingomonas sp. 1P06PA]|uniref:DUF3617 domain-containing protein n=1 Tax=Sphingomonas sp. 1P06PA TaxID=554121 RepID=UPI0039A5D27E
MRAPLACLLLLAPLSACGSGDAEGNQAAAKDAPPLEAIATTDGRMRIAPGLWRSETRITKMEMPGMPAGARDQAMAAMQGRSNSFQHCVTPAEAARPAADLFTGRQDSGCAYENFAMTGGRIDATLVCRGQDGGEMRMKLAGSFTADGYAIDYDMAMPGGPGLTMAGHTEGRRIGACTANTAK